MAKRKWWSGGVRVASDTGEPPPTNLEIYPRHYRGMQVYVEDPSRSTRSQGYRSVNRSVWIQLTPEAAYYLYQDLGKMLRLVKA